MKGMPLYSHTETSRHYLLVNSLQEGQLHLQMFQAFLQMNPC